MNSNAANHTPVSTAAPATRAESERETIVPLHSELDIDRALAPWRGQAARHARAKLRLVLTDLSVLVFCFLVGRLPLTMREDQGVVQALGNWWTEQGQLRLTLFLGISALMVAWMGAVNGHYTAGRRKPWWDELRQLLTVIAVAAMADAVFNYLGKWQISRLWTGLSWALVFVLLPVTRYYVRRQLLAAGLLAQPYVLVGHAEDVNQAAAALASEPLMGYVPVAVVCPEPLPGIMSLSGKTLAPICLSPGVRQYLSEPGDYQVVAVLPEHNAARLRDFAQNLMLTRDDVIIVPALSGLPMLGMEVSHFFSHEVLLLRARNNLNRKATQIVKRALDLVGASVGLVLLAPLFAWVAWRIKRDDPGGPVLFFQPRIGREGKPFSFIKFRSMVMNADEALERWKDENPALYVRYLASNFKLANDPRVTKIGSFIRRTSIDELPQLINVLKGDMSLVGPRPLLARELPEYGPSIAAYGKARPGITGLWQISGRSSSTFQHRINMDLWYTRNWSLWYDIVILARTVKVVLNQEGAS